jgi:hypothetical protein
MDLPGVKIKKYKNTQVVPAFSTLHSFSVTFFLPFGLRLFFILLKIKERTHISLRKMPLSQLNREMAQGALHRE